MPIHYEKRGAVGLFTIDNGRLGVLNPPMHMQMYEHLRAFVMDDEVRVGVLAGKPGCSFSAGDDLKFEQTRTKKQMLDAHLDPGPRMVDPPGRPGWEQEVMRMDRFKPIVGAVDGYCLGQGFIYLTLLTDLRICTPQAEFGLPEIAYGMGGMGGLIRLGRQMPHTAAMWLALTGERVGARKALSWNFVNEIVEPEALMDRAMEIAGLIARQPPAAVRIEMEAMQRGMDLSKADALTYIGHMYRMTVLGGATEGITPAFLQKKKG